MLQPSTLDKPIAGIWEQLHNPSFLLQFSQWQAAPDTQALSPALADPATGDFHVPNKHCHRVSCIGRTMRSVEVIVRAHWIECFDSRVETLKKQCPSLRLAELRKTAPTEACADLVGQKRDSEIECKRVPCLESFGLVYLPDY